MPFRFRRSSLIAASLLAAATLGLACAEEAAPAGSDRSATGNEDDIIGGVDASGAGLNAIGTLGREGYSGDFSYFCTATLVSPTVVLSAKHCLQDGVADVFFAIGPDSKKPIKKVRAKEVKLAPDGEGGFVELGQDVALVILEEAITDVKPLRYVNGHIPEAKVGTKLTAVGFGVHDRERNSGVRRAGALTLQAVSGQPLTKLFATLADLVAVFVKSDGQDYVDNQTARITKFYGLTLKDNAEAYLGLGKDDAQPCSGDSGGPLIGRVNNENIVFAVVSGSFKTRAYPCSVVGEVYATFPPQVQEMLATAIGNNDQAMDPLTGKADEERGPCGYTTVRGHCDGVLAVRCVSDEEGPQKVTKTDCSLIGQVCGIDKDNRAGCVDDPNAPPPQGGSGGSSGGTVGTAGAGAAAGTPSSGGTGGGSSGGTGAGSSGGTGGGSSGGSSSGGSSSGGAGGSGAGASGSGSSGGTGGGSGGNNLSRQRLNRGCRGSPSAIASASAGRSRRAFCSSPRPPTPRGLLGSPSASI